MTIPQMADVAGVSPETIRRKIKEIFPDRIQNGKPTALNQAEATAVLAAVRKANFVSPSPEQPAQIVEVVKALIPAMAEAFRLALGGHSVPTPPVPALEAPALTPRHELRRLIARGMERFGGYREAWHELYAQAYYRLGRNIRLCAENRGMEPLDFAENEGLLPQLVAIAREVFA